MFDIKLEPSSDAVSAENCTTELSTWRLLGYWGLSSAALLTAGLLLYQAAGGSDFAIDTLTHATPTGRR